VSHALPEGWSRSKLGALVQPSKRKADPGQANGRPYLGLEHIESATNRIISKADSSRVKSTTSVFSQGDVLFSKLRPYLNKVAVAPFDGVGSTEILVFERQANLESKYLMWFLSQQETVRVVNERAAGVQLPRVTFEKIADIEVPVAPLSEQRRIVEKVEVIFEQVSRAKERLDRVPVILKRLRQTVLAAAYAGLLTERVRPPLAQSERVASVDGRFELEPESALPELPPGWIYVPIGNVASFQQGMQIAKSTRLKQPGPGRLPILRIGNYANGFADDVEYAKVDADTLVAEADDLILTRTGETRGKVLTGYRGVFHNNTFRINFDTTIIWREYLLGWLQSRYVQTYIAERSGRSAQPDLTHKAFGSCPFPLAPLDEQRDIAKRVDGLLTLMRRLERRVQAAASRAASLSQAVLSKAFAGELVPTEAELARVEGRTYQAAPEPLERLRALDRSNDITGAKRHQANGSPANSQPPKRRVRAAKSSTKRT
jgi:type I restriction enzyme, S subunit